MQTSPSRKHIILKWNPSADFHPDAPDTIRVHGDVLRHFEGTRDKYVWWGKICKRSKSLPVKATEISEIRKQIDNSNGKETHIYLYCPDHLENPTLHVGLLLDISTTDHRNDLHTPNYYSDISGEIKYWFKIGDIRRIPRKDIENLIGKDLTKFDPVGSTIYPSVVYEKVSKEYFLHEIFEDFLRTCFKTGGICGRSSQLILIPKQVFVGMRFSDEFKPVYTKAIKPALESIKYIPWHADEKFESVDIMCKVCFGIQTSEFAIIDITEWSPNVLFELGILYGLSKKVILIKEETQKIPIDLSGMYCIPYKMRNVQKLKKDLTNKLVR